MAQCHCQEIEELHGGIRHPNLGCAGSGEIPLRIRVVYTIKMTLTQKKTRIVRRLTRRCTTALQIDDLETVITDIGAAYLYAEGSAIILITIDYRGTSRYLDVQVEAGSTRSVPGKAD
jgi:hypothetical protein